LRGSLARYSRQSSFAEFARGFGFLEAICDKVLVFRPPFGLLCLGLEGWMFLGHMNHVFRSWYETALADNFGPGCSARVTE
jgi:hypothetical protein